MTTVATLSAALLMSTKFVVGAVCPEANGFALEPGCPDNSASYSQLPTCDEDLLPGDFCEGDGECSTSNSLNNCGNGWDVYLVRACKQNLVPAYDTYTGTGECPDDLNFGSMKQCYASHYHPGNYCEGDGECSTEQDLDNCRQSPGGARNWDIYDICPQLTPIDSGECPAHPSSLPKCNEVDTPGTLCEGDGECLTDDALNNCYNVPSPYDVYRVCAGSQNGGVGLVPVTVCPTNVDFGQMPHCASQGLQLGDYCEGDGECGTDPNLNNCNGYDVYGVGGKCPGLSLTAVAANNCPDETEKSFAELPNCAAPFLKQGDLCEGDGECGTSNNLNNCGANWDIYYLKFGITGGTITWGGTWGG